MPYRYRLQGEAVVIKSLSSPCPLIRGSSHWSYKGIVITGKTFWKNDFICTVVCLETEERATNSYFVWFEQQFIFSQKTIKINVLNLTIKGQSSSFRLKLMILYKVYIINKQSMYYFQYKLRGKQWFTDLVVCLLNNYFMCFNFLFIWKYIIFIFL